MEEIFSIVETFREKFYSIVRGVPEGRVTTYGTIADALGDPRAARAVGVMLNKSKDHVGIPCHRVVRSDGSVGGYVEGKQKKIDILESEGLRLEEGKVINFRERLFRDFDTNYPLKRLKRHQVRVSEEVVVGKNNEKIRYVGGLDTSYSRSEAYSVLCVYDIKKDDFTTFSIKSEIKFPYIPTYLSFRELPNYVELVKMSDIEVDVFMVDGNGILHPENIGLASHLGVIIDEPTIGVAKSKLCGRLANDIGNGSNASAIVDKNNNKIGYALLSTDNVSNPIYVSPGHKIGVERSLDIVKKLCSYKIPKPVRKAHIKANELRKRTQVDIS